MSTKSTILYSANTGNHIWEETNEPINRNGKVIAYNIYGLITFKDELKSLEFPNDHVQLNFVEDSYFHYLFKEGLQILMYDLHFLEINESGIYFSLYGASISAIEIRKAKEKADKIPVVHVDGKPPTKEEVNKFLKVLDDLQPDYSKMPDQLPNIKLK
jgi:hypothetical protein